MQEVGRFLCALETGRRVARRYAYADARVMDIRQRDLSTKNGQVGTLAESESLRHGHSRHGAGLAGDLPPPTG